MLIFILRVLGICLKKLLTSRQHANFNLVVYAEMYIAWSIFLFKKNVYYVTKILMYGQRQKSIYTSNLQTWSVYALGQSVVTSSNIILYLLLVLVTSNLHRKFLKIIPLFKVDIVDSLW